MMILPKGLRTLIEDFVSLVWWDLQGTDHIVLVGLSGATLIHE